MGFNGQGTFWELIKQPSGVLGQYHSTISDQEEWLILYVCGGISRGCSGGCSTPFVLDTSLMLV